MKILPCIFLVTLLAVTFPVQSQTVLNGQKDTRATASVRTVEAFNARERNTGNESLARRLDAIMNSVISQGKHVPSSKSVLSNGWVRSWYLTKTWSKGAWENLVQATFTYDLFGNQLSQLGQTWENSAWKNSLLQTWTYDEQGNEITHGSLGWNGSAWIESAIDTEMYNADGQRTTTLSRYLSGSAWVNQYLYTYAYDANGNETIDLCQNWSGGAWVNSRRWTFTYDANGYYVKFLWEVWSNGAWVNYGQSIITNDPNGRETYSLQQIWNNGAWVNYGQDTFTYDGNGRKATDLYDTWTNNAWVHSQVNSFTYDANGNKTDELEQAWKSNAWVNSAWYIDTWQKVPAIQVTKPATSEVVLAGEPYHIHWRTAGIDSLTIELSVDGGTTFQEVSRSVPAGTGHYSWMVPDTFSTRCKLRISDLSDPSTSVLSGRFRIKGYRLTRIDANGDYEAFDPGVHGWNFRNDTTSMWPASWWKQFDYRNGIDPYRGKRYDNGWWYYPLDAIHSDDHVDWPLFVRTFSIDSCYRNFAKGQYSQVALTLWYFYAQLRRGFTGACLGFAVSSLLAFEHPVELLQKFPEVGGFQNIHDLPLDSLRRRVINQIYETQYGYRHYRWIVNQKEKKSLRNTLDDLKNSLFSDSLNHRHLGIFDSHSGGHAVTPYRLKRTGGDGVWGLYVYDSNCPTGDCHGVITIDSLHNVWLYPPLGWSNTGTGIVLNLEPLDFLNMPEMWDVAEAPLLDEGVASSSHADHGQAVSYVRLFNSDAAITITNVLGQTAGFHDSTAFSGISDGLPIIPETGSFQRPIGYFLPSGVYFVQMLGFADSNAAFTAFSGLQMFRYWRKSAGNSQTDLLTYNSGLAIGNPDQETKTLNLESIARVGSDERVFEVLNCAAIHADSMSITTPDVDRLKVENRGPQKTYDLRIELAASNGGGQFVHAGITMPANSSQYIVPDWMDLQNQPVKIYEDIGNTGKIHDTLTLTNQLTGVDGQLNPGIPQEFRLEQNYPNPFNPLTTIRYGLPVRSHVTLTVFNTLGQQVAVLQNSEQGAGYHDVKFDGTGFASGVYFYRIQAGTFTEVKKLVLVR